MSKLINHQKLNLSTCKNQTRWNIEFLRAVNGVWWFDIFIPTAVSPVWLNETKPNSCPDLVPKPHPAFHCLQYQCVEMLLLSICFYYFHSWCMCKNGNTDCVHAERYSPIVLHLLHQGFWIMMRVILMSYLLEEVFSHCQLLDASLGLGQGFTWHPTNPNTFGDLYLLVLYKYPI